MLFGHHTLGADISFADRDIIVLETITISHPYEIFLVSANRPTKSFDLKIYHVVQIFIREVSA